MAFLKKMFGKGDGGGGGAEPEPEEQAPTIVPLPGIATADGAAVEEESPFFSGSDGAGGKVNKDAFDLIRVLGQGSFGQVFLVRKKDTGDIYAMKVLKKQNLLARQQVEHTRAERNVLERMRGVPFIVHVRYAFQSHDK
eukprot:COSAG05_NODE_3343_length_2139_cov_24.751471_1_plen_138_part_10